MRIRFTKDVEKERVEKQKETHYNSTWEYYSGTSLVEALHKARDMGWKDKKVQVRHIKSEEGITYFVEPYEQGCGCHGILKYGDFFD